MKKSNKYSIIAVLAVSIVLVAFGLTGIIRAALTVNLGTADSFAILAGSAITNIGPSVISGNVGLSPAGGVSYAGLTAAEVTGTIYAVDAAGPAGSVNNPALLTTAKNDLVTAYNNATGQTPASTVPTELGGTTKTAGTYNSADGTFGITGTLTLDAQGNPDAVFIFKTASTLITAASSTVTLANGAQACHVFWQVGSSATLGTNSVFKGNILALTSATLTTGANVEGRVLARNGAVTLDTNTVTVPVCTAEVTSQPVAQNRGTLTVVKQVINDNGKTKTYSDFNLFVDGNGLSSVQSGHSGTFFASNEGVVYTVSETADTNYTLAFSGDCDSNGRVTLYTNNNKFCVLTNDDKGTAVAVPPVPPLIDVVKVPSPLALPAGPGQVTYTYTLRNVGTVPVTDITMIGDTCSPIILISGDTDGDARLDLNETWTYRCSTILPATHTNIVTTIGWANGVSATDIANATVVVGASTVPPLIHVTKVPSPLTFSAGGGLITYTNKVTNPGTVALSNVRLADDKCGSVTYVSGDTNGDSKLDTTETWTYTCLQNITKTVTNTVIATGEANGLTARDVAVATVVVALPKLPNTGNDPGARNNILILIGFLSLAAVSLIVVALRRRTVKS